MGFYHGFQNKTANEVNKEFATLAANDGLLTTISDLLDDTKYWPHKLSKDVVASLFTYFNKHHNK